MAVPLIALLTIGMALAQAGIASAQASAQRQNYQAQVLQQKANQASLVDQYRRSVTEATQRQAQEDAKFAQQREEEQRNKLYALGVLENRAGSSGQLGQAVDLTLGDMYASLARQENIGDYNERILRQNTEGTFREMGNSFVSAYNQASPYLQKPSGFGQALEVVGSGLQGALQGYQLGSGVSELKNKISDFNFNKNNTNVRPPLKTQKPSIWRGFDFNTSFGIGD